MEIKRSINHRENKCWRCNYPACESKRGKKSIKSLSFFENFNFHIRLVLKVLFRWCVDIQISSISKSLGISSGTVTKIIDTLVKKLIEKDESENQKLGGGNSIVQIDETMLNYSAKNHVGEPASHKTDALCIVETINGRITKSFATTIPDKKALTLVPIICSKVCPGSVIIQMSTKAIKP